jgi:hypothetical protein
MEPIKIVKLKEEYVNAFAAAAENAERAANAEHPITTILAFPFRILNIMTDTGEVLVGTVQHGIMSMQRKAAKAVQGDQPKLPPKNIEIKPGKSPDLLN